jgi:hypothetical protein
MIDRDLQVEIVNYRPRPFKALFLLALGFMFGGSMLPQFLAARHHYYAGNDCMQLHPLPPRLP